MNARLNTVAVLAGYEGIQAGQEAFYKDLHQHPELSHAEHRTADRVAGTVGTHSGPFMSAEDGIKVTVYGRGAHGALPQYAIDPVVLAAMIIVRLQTVVSREVTPGEIAILTVGSVQAGTRGNVIPDHAVLQLNLRSYSPPTRQTVSEDFGIIPDAAGIPYTYWGIGRTDRQAYLTAEKAGRLQDLPTNHSPKFLPPLHPTLRTGTETLVTAALAWLAKLCRTDLAPADPSLHAAARDA